jgi:hypothetical protein
MKYLKLFEEFTSYNPKTSYSGIPKLSERRSKGSVNWFTKDEIEKIRERASQLGVPRILNRSRGGVSMSFFGEANGLGGLEESIYNFFTRGGNLCNTVSIETKRGDYQIVKREGEFRLNGKNVGSDVSGALSMML